MVEQKSISLRAWAGLLLLALIWGASFLSNAVMLREMAVQWIVASRVGLGALVLWVYVLIRGLSVPRSGTFWRAAAVMGMFNNVVPFMLITWGQQHIASGLASILNASTAFFGILIAALVFADERLTPHKLIGVTLGLGGVALVIGVSALRGFSITSLGQLAVIGAAISYGVTGSFARARLTGIRPEVAALGMLTCSTIVMLPLAWLVAGPPPTDLSADVIAATLYLAVIATGVAYLLYYWLAKAAGSGNLLLVTLLVAPVAVALGAIWLNESLSPQAYAGFALIAAGMILIDGRVWRKIAGHGARRN
ncbi:DMT family transporter [Aliiroseovarius sp. PTFE2010]|uniref:DMT family transporter n=1 Tax=Aliiroseovarius sp. PTFE2010 TaxID=3417190 RepID=UPI003CF0822F